MKILKSFSLLAVLFALSVIFVLNDPKALETILWAIRIVIAVFVGLFVALLLLVADLITISKITNLNFLKFNKSEDQ
jgi:hypothetical protein